MSIRISFHAPQRRCGYVQSYQGSYASVEKGTYGRHVAEEFNHIIPNFNLYQQLPMNGYILVRRYNKLSIY